MFACPPWTDPEAWLPGCWVSNVRGYQLREAGCFARQYSSSDPRSHIDLVHSCLPYSRRLSAAWETYAPCQGSVWIRDEEQWNGAAEKRARRRDWSSSDGGVGMEVETPVEQVCRPVAAASFQVCGVQRRPSLHWSDSSWWGDRVARRCCGRTRGTGAPLSFPCLQSPTPARKESYQRVSNSPYPNAGVSRAHSYHTPLRCIGPIFTTCRNFSLFKIPSRRPLVMPATLRSLVPLII